MNGSKSWQTGPYDAITDVPGIRVGHWTDRRRATGCTVIRCEGSTFVAVDARGGAPGTRETDVLSAGNVVRKAHAILFTGGSAFGLAAATGVMRLLAEQGIGFGTTAAKVPIVSAAVLFDLGMGAATAFPDEHAGYLAGKRAKGGSVAQGSVGAGTGATVAKLLGLERSLKGGVGTASIVGPRGFVVGALVANNAVGGITDPDSGRVIAGPRSTKGRFVPMAEAMEMRTAQMDALMQNTVLVCVATNAALEHNQLQRLAIQAHDGLARTVFPAHTFGDGDIAFAIGMAQVDARPDDATILGIMTVGAVERAILRSVESAHGTNTVPSAAEWRLTKRA